MEILNYYINKKMVYVQVERTSNKNMYLKVKGNDLVVSAPKRTKLKYINEFVAEHIEKFSKYIEDKKKYELYSIKDLYVNYLGKKYNIVSLTGFKKSSIKFSGKTAYINTKGGTDEELEKAIKAFLKDDLISYINKEIKKYEKKMKLPEHEVKVVFKTSTWGTNMVGRFRISFSSRLSHYRREITDYVIVHELAHTIEPNHSSAFWDVVETYCPEYKTLRKELKADKSLSE